MNVKIIEEHCELLSQLPKSIRTELMFRQNITFIQKVKLFQLSDVSFVIALLRLMKPMICMAGDHIVRVGELAESMYFIKRGLAKVVCADDEKIVISYLGEGSYFGEVGILMGGKRSTSVIAHTDCLLFSIDKDSLLTVLKEFSHHKKFLDMVAQQRLETTYAKDLQIMEGSNLPLSDTRANPHEFSIIANSFKNSKTLAKPVESDQSSGIWNFIWTVMTLLSIAWNVFYTSFGLCFGIEITDYTALVSIDAVALFIYACDLVLQLIYKPPVYVLTSFSFYNKNNHNTFLETKAKRMPKIAIPHLSQG